MLPDDLARITDYVAGELSAEDMAGTAQWIAEDSERQTLARRLQWAQEVHQQAMASDRGVEPRVEVLLERIQAPANNARCTQGVPSHPSGTSAFTRSLSQRGFSRTGIFSGPALSKAAYAALAVVAASVVAVLALSRGDLSGRQQLLPVRFYKTGAGQQATVMLADGSHAQLGPVSTLSVTAEPAGKRVEAQVSGEVLFTVAHHAQTSFQVHTSNAVTRVLGTTFLVRRYLTDRVTQVVVADGRVSLSGTRNSIQHLVPILKAHTLGAVDDSGHVLVTPNIAVDDYTAWTTGQLVFHDTPIYAIAAELSRAYNVEIRIVDSARAEQHLNWTVPLAQRSLGGILETLGDFLEAHPVRAGRVITFVSGRAAARRSPVLPSSSTSERQYGK